MLQLLAVIGGALLIGLFHEDISSLGAITVLGGATIGVAALVSIYEVIMIAFALIEHVNHPARLTVVSIIQVATSYRQNTRNLCMIKNVCITELLHTTNSQ